MPKLLLGVLLPAAAAGVVLAIIVAGGGPDDPEPPRTPAPEPARPARALDGPPPVPFESEALRAPPVSGPPALVAHGSGWGHGVGMSQYGAQAQALAGRSHEEILAHYYLDTELTQAPEETERIRVNLFLNRGDLDRSRLRLRTQSRDGGAPDRPVEVELGDGDPVELPWPQTWTLTADADELVLADNRGEERRRGPGPARVRYAFRDGNPTLLRLPQLVPATSTTRLSGTFAWGALEVTEADGQLQPVVVVSLEHYLRGIAEVPSRWEPAALAAQAVTARTYAVRQMREPLGATCRCHLGATPHHQVYVGYSKEGVEHGDRWRDAVSDTAGEVLTYEGDLAWTFYSSSHGGRSEHSEDSWAYAAEIPYLRSVDDPWSLDPDLDNPYASWRRRIGNAELAELAGGALVEIRGVRVVSRTEGGSPRVLELHGVDEDGEPHAHRWDGGDAGSAATALKRHYGAHLPSQQIEAIGLEPFHDDAGRPGEYATVRAHEAGLVRGCDEGSRLVCPDGTVTRGELAVALLRGLRGAGDPAEDLAAAVGSADEDRAAAEAVEAGLLPPCPDGCPDEEVSRAEAAVALAAALDLRGAAPEHADAADHPDAEALGAVAEAGLVDDCDDGALCPDADFTREALAVAVARGFDLE